MLLLAADKLNPQQLCVHWSLLLHGCVCRPCFKPERCVMSGVCVFVCVMCVCSPQKQLLCAPAVQEKWRSAWEVIQHGPPATRTRTTHTYGVRSFTPEHQMDNMCHYRRHRRVWIEGKRCFLRQGFSALWSCSDQTLFNNSKWSQHDWKLRITTQVKPITLFYIKGLQWA